MKTGGKIRRQQFQQKKIENPTLNSSNLELAINKALSLSEFIEKIWTEGDLKQKQNLQNLVFRSGLGYDKPNERVRTPKVNAIFGSIPILSREISNIKNGEPIPVNQFSGLVTQTFKSSNFSSSFYSVLILEYDAFFSPAGIEKSNSIDLDINSP